jgi:hypothetical protein
MGLSSLPENPRPKSYSPRTLSERVIRRRDDESSKAVRALAIGNKCCALPAAVAAPPPALPYEWHTSHDERATAVPGVDVEDERRPVDASCPVEGVHSATCSSSYGLLQVRDAIEEFPWPAHCFLAPRQSFWSASSVWLVEESV